jgi:antA/antB antirepressor domain protein
MKELIKITEQNGTKAVSARELYEFLGYNKAVWSRWYQKNIIDNEFAFENIDYQTLNIMLNGNETKDFALSIEFAKKISMMARTEKGEEARRYFIECEKLAQNPVSNLSKIDLAQMVIESEREKERLQIQNQLQSEELQKQAPKVAYYEEVLQSQSTYNTNQIAKELGTSAITLNKKLRDLGVQYKQGGTWLLYHKYQNKGYTKTQTYPFVDSNGNTQTSMQTVWTEEGRLFIHKILKQELATA